MLGRYFAYEICIWKPCLSKVHNLTAQHNTESSLTLKFILKPNGKQPCTLLSPHDIYPFT